MIDYLGTPAGVREICKNLNIQEVPDAECLDDLRYGFGQILLATGKDDWDGTEKLYGFASKVDEEFAAVNIAFRTNVPVEIIQQMRRDADKDLERLYEADASMLASQTTGDTGVSKHGGYREYNYVTLNPDKEFYMTPELN